MKDTYERYEEAKATQPELTIGEFAQMEYDNAVITAVHGHPCANKAELLEYVRSLGMRITRCRFDALLAAHCDYKAYLVWVRK